MEQNLFILNFFFFNVRVLSVPLFVHFATNCIYRGTNEVCKSKPFMMVSPINPLANPPVLTRHSRTSE